MVSSGDVGLPSEADAQFSGSGAGIGDPAVVGAGAGM
jgi:hypothetical protein